MEEKKKGMSPILIIILSILGICLVGFLVWYGVNYFKGEEKTNTPTGDNPTNVGVTNVQKELYESLRNNQGGFYFDKSVSINDISAKEFLEYVLGMYVKENNLTLSDNLDCVTDNGNHYGDCADVKVPYASKETIDSYIKNKFNTTRVLTLPSDVNGGNLSSLSGNDLGDYYYDANKQMYYFGWGARGSGYEKNYTKLLDVKEEGNNIYFYDKMLHCSSGVGDVCWTSADQEFFTTALFEFVDLARGKKYDEVLSYGNEGFVLNEDYVFEKYADKLNTYKHTFKKVDGKYYWVSSEIVK